MVKLRGRPTARTSGMRIGTGVATVAVATGLLLTGATAATAAPAAGASPQSPQASTCRTHNPPGGGSVTVCRTWTADGHGAYNGTWTITNKTGNATAQGRFDVYVGTLATTGTYKGIKSFVTRGCNLGCTDWS